MDEIRRPKFLLHVEVPILLVFYAMMVSDPVRSNFTIYRTCYVILGYNESDCALLGTANESNATQDLEELVQPYANIVSIALVWPAQILPVLTCLFVGPWSDKNGRKPVMITCLIGFVIAGICQVIIASIQWASPWYGLIPSLVSSCLGGFAPFLMLLLCYITDVTTDENRGFRIGCFEAVLALGSLLGTLSSSFIFGVIGYAGVFATSVGCNILALLYIVFCMPETIVRSTDDNNNIWSLKNVKDMFQTLLKRRENHLRTILLFMIVVMTLYVLASFSDSSVIFYYFREKFHWDLEKYTLFKSATGGTFIVGTFVGLYLLHKLLHLHETTMLLIGFVMLCTSVIIQGLAEHDWQLYLAAGLRCITGIVGPMCRSFISKSVANDEIGKIFSITVMLEMSSVIIGAPLYSYIYNETISTNSGIFNFVTAGILFVDIALTIVVVVMKNKFMDINVPYQPLLVNS